VITTMMTAIATIIVIGVDRSCSCYYCMIPS
jgi:hypothetical protein